MKIRSSSRWALVGLACVAVLVFALTVSSQQRVQSTTQLTVRTPVVADPLAEWGRQYAEALKVAEELKASGKADHGRRLEYDLRALDEALRDFVRASERLQHRDRAIAETMDFLMLQNAMQMESRQFNAVSNALKVRHDSAMAAIRNLK
jgi:hypothetical protein